MKSILFFLLLIPSFLSAQYTFTAKDGTVLENKSKYTASGVFGSSLQYHTLTDYGFKIETVNYGFGGAIDDVNVEEITFGDLLIYLNANEPEVKKHKDYLHYFYISEGRSNTGNLVYYSKYSSTSEPKFEKETHMVVSVKGNMQEAKDYLNMLKAKAKEVTSQPGYTDDRSNFTAFNKLDQAAMDKKVEDELAGLDLDLTSDEDKAAKAAEEKNKKAQQAASYTPVYFKRTNGDIAYSIYYVDDKYSSLKTYVYQGDKEKLLFKTYNTVYNGGSRMAKSADFTNCSWCSIYSIIGEGSKILIKDKPNSIKYEIIYKNNQYNLVKGSGSLTEQNYDSRLQTLCYLSTDGNNFYTKSKGFTIEGYKLNQQQTMFVLTMIFMAGYEENTVMD